MYTLFQFCLSYLKQSAFPDFPISSVIVVNKYFHDFNRLSLSLSLSLYLFTFLSSLPLRIHIYLFFYPSLTLVIVNLCSTFKYYIYIYIYFFFFFFLGGGDIRGERIFITIAWGHVEVHF